MSLRHRVNAVSALRDTDISALNTLFCQAFEADSRGFRSDLKDKDYVLRLWDGAEVVAFSTLKLMVPEPGVRLLFSGDTYADPAARWGHSLPLVWAEFVFRQLPAEPGCRDYWLLFCSGFRTYRILPTFFKRYVPGPGTGTDALSRRRDRWAQQLFGESYAQGTVVPRFATPLKDPEPPKRLENDPHVRFFFEQNPHSSQGHELVCLTALTEENLKPAGLRLARGGSRVLAAAEQ